MSYPILFTGDMVKAILADRKTQTRPIIKPQPIDNTEIDGNFFEGTHKGYVKVDGHSNWQEQFSFEFCKYGKVGDILWVKETFQYVDFAGEDNGYVYRATDPDWETMEEWTWKPSIFMPKKACRLFLEITDIRVERLKDISIDDACEEGIEYCNVDTEAFEGGELIADYKNYMWKDDENYEDYYFPYYADPLNSFKSLWQSINGKESWNENTWVWVISFKRTECPKGFI